MKKRNLMSLLIFCLLIISEPVKAELKSEIILDGTIGSAEAIQSQNDEYLIKNLHGIVVEKNIYLSFEKFFISSRDKVIFDMPSSIQNIIIRVTSHEKTHINGEIEISDQANIFLLCPSGIAFGSDLRFYSNGSINISTAHYLAMVKDTNKNEIGINRPYTTGFNLGQSIEILQIITNNNYTTVSDLDINNDSKIGIEDAVSILKQISLIENPINNYYFYSFPVKDEILSNKNPVYLGYIDSNISPIKFDSNPDLIPENGASIIISPGKMISLIASEIHLNNTLLNAASGNIFIACVNNSGEIYFNDLDSETVTSFSNLKGDLFINNDSMLFVSGTGKIKIFTGKTHLENSLINAHNDDDSNGNYVEFNLDSFDCVDSKISVETVTFGHGSDITINAEGSISFTNSQLYSGSFYEYSGDAGNIRISAKNITLENSNISTDTSGSGNAGDILLLATEFVKLNEKSYISNNTSFEYVNAGNAGSISMESNDILLYQNSKINNQTNGTGHGGNVNIFAKNQIMIDNDSLITTITSSNTDYAGNAGNIAILSSFISMKQGAKLSSATTGSGSGGDIQINSKKDIIISGTGANGESSSIRTRSLGLKNDAGNCGNISLSSVNTSLLNGAWLSSESYGPGKGGDICIYSESILLTGTNDYGYASILYSSSYKAEAGKVIIVAKNALFSEGASIITHTERKGASSQINIKALDLIFEGVNPHGQNSDGLGSGIHVYCMNDDTTATQISIEANTLSIINGATIDYSLSGNCHGGNISINADNSIIVGGKVDESIEYSPLAGQLYFLDSNPESKAITISGIYLNSNNGNIGSLDVRADKLYMFKEAKLSVNNYGSGDSGFVNISVESLFEMSEKSLINTLALNGNHGLINIENSGSFKMTSSSIRTDITGSNIEKSGNISIQSESILIDNSILTANNYAGSGGSITIFGETINISHDTVLEASSELSLP